MKDQAQHIEATILQTFSNALRWMKISIICWMKISITFAEVYTNWQ